MSDIFTVMKFTMIDMLKRKSFIVSTIIILLLIIVGFNVPNLIKAFSNDDGLEHMIISDKYNLYEGSLNTLKDLKNYDFTIGTYSLDEIKDIIKNDEKMDSGIYIEESENGVKLTYIVKSAVFKSAPNEDFVDAITSLYKNIQINKLNLTPAEMARINPVFDYNTIQTDEEAKGNVLAMMLMSVVLFYAVYFCAYQVSSSITTEKTSKIIETLVTSTSPKNIVLGKTFGIGLVGLGQLILFLITAIFSGNTFMDKELLAIVLDTSTLTPFLALITLLYFVLGYLTYALLYALTGSTVSKPEDIQSANSPVAIITVIGFYLSYFTMMNPASELNKIAGLLPISSPFCMPFRVMMGLANNTELALSILILAVTILLIAHVTIKIYSNAILNYGTKLTFKDIKVMYKQK